MSTRSHPRFGRIGALVEERQVGSFFALTLVFSWALWLPLALDRLDGPALPLIVLGGFGPAAAAAVVTWLAGGDVRGWLAGVARWRVGRRWYAVALLLPLALVAVQNAGYAAAGNPLDASNLPLRAATFLANLPFVFLLGGGQEEVGWRGFALPRLQRRRSPLTASLLIGAVWGLWHLPLFAVPASSQYGFPAAPYLGSVLAMSVVFTWLYNETGGSVLLAMLLHASVNASTALYLVPADAAAGGVPLSLAAAMTAAYWAVALALVAAYGRDLSHDPVTSVDRRSAESGTDPQSGEFAG